MQEPRVLVADPLDDAGVRRLAERGLLAELDTGLSEAQLIAKVAPFEAILVRSSTTINEAVLQAATSLRVVARAGVGVDNIDLDAATAHGVLVVNTPTGNTLAATEHTMALLLAVARNVAPAHAALTSGRWDKKKYAGVELSGKTLGVVGLGRIGREVAKRAKSFGMRLIGFDPYVSQDAAKALGVELVGLDDVFSLADFVTLHTPLTDQTRHVVDAARLATMKPTAYLINVARGGLVDEHALRNAVDQGVVAGAAIDVFEDEPPSDSPLMGHERILVTPHLGASTREAQEKVAVQAADLVADYLLDGRVANATNLTHAPDPAVQPYMSLASALGSFAAQVSQGQPAGVTVHCAGEAAARDATPIAVSALVGILRGSADERINIVNASAKAKERGLRLVQTQTTDAEDYAASVRVTLTTDRSEVTVLGTHLARLGARMVEIDGYDVEFKPTGRFVVVHHRDEPGTIAKISTVLGEANVNIAQMVVGRKAPRGEAVSLLRVDDDVAEAVLAKVRQALGTPDVRSVWVPGGDHQD